MKKTSLRGLTARPWVRIAAALAAALVAFVVLFDWNWLSGPLARHLTGTSGREVKIGHLDVDFGAGLEPTVHLRGIYVENASWATARQPLVTMKEAWFTFSLQSLWQRRPVITRMTLVDVDIDMERRVDGLRNWRLLDPEDREPGRVKVLTLEAHGTRLRFANRAVDLEFLVTANDAGIAAGGSDALTSRVAFQGRYQGADFSGEAMTPKVLSFRDSGLTFPMQGHLASRGTRLEFDGLFTDLFDMGPMDAKVRLAGPSLALLYPFLRMQPHASRPYRVEAQLKQTGKVFDFGQLKATIGRTALAGSVVYDHSADRPLLRASLSSEAADFDDVRPLLGMNAPQGARDPGARGAAGEGGAGIFPSKTFHTESLRAVDARVSARARRFSAPGWPAFQQLHVEAALDHGLLEANQIEAGLSGGRLNAKAVVDARQPLAVVTVSAQLEGIRVEALAPSLAAKAGAAGSVNGRLELKGRGDSVAAIVGHASGSFAATMDRGHLSNLADAKLGLNVGKVISVFLRGDREIAINCARVAFDVKDGIGKSRALVADTEQTHVEGAGTMDLKREQVDIRLVPVPKKPGLLTRDGAIRIRGGLRGPALSIEDRGDAAPSYVQGKCAAVAER